MKTHYFFLYIFLFLSMIDFNGKAQTPQFYNSNTTTASTGLPFNSYDPVTFINNNKGQWIFGPNLFHTSGTTGSPVTAGSSIKKVYIRRTNGTNFMSYSNFSISLGQGAGTSTSFGTAINTSYPYVTPLNSVYSSASFTFTDSLPGWYGFTLSTPFSYDPSQSLVLELKSNITFTVSNGDLLATTSNTGMYQNISGYQSYTAGLNGLGIIDFGFDTSIVTGCTGTPNAGTLTATSDTICSGGNDTLRLIGASTGLTYEWLRANNSNGPWIVLPNNDSIYVTAPTGNKCYMCIVTCINSGLSDTSNVYCIYGLPSSNTISTITTCVPYTLNGQTYSTSGTYLQQYTNSYGCDSNFTLNLTIAPLNLATTLTGYTITAAQSGATYQWINCNGNTIIPNATAQSYTTTSNGAYAVIISLTGGCTDTSACTYVIATNVNNTKEDNSIISIYPNPTSGQFTVELIENAQVEITNMIGATIYKNLLPKGKQIIHLENESDGIYFVKISSEGKEQTIKLNKIK